MKIRFLYSGMNADVLIRQVIASAETANANLLAAGPASDAGVFGISELIASLPVYFPVDGQPAYPDDVVVTWSSAFAEQVIETAEQQIRLFTGHSYPADVDQVVNRLGDTFRQQLRDLLSASWNSWAVGAAPDLGFLATGCTKLIGDFGSAVQACLAGTYLPPDFPARLGKNLALVAALQVRAFIGTMSGDDWRTPLDLSLQNPGTDANAFPAFLDLEASLPLSSNATWT